MGISKELQAIDDILLELHERIRSGRCLTNKQQNIMMLNFLHTISNKDEPMSKTQSYRYIGISIATFDRYVASGDIPKGKKALWFTELVWYARNLDPVIDRLLSKKVK